jgi:hypothetical protein
MGVGRGELKKRCPNCLDANVEIIIKSRTFKKTEAGYDEYNSSRIYNRIDRFDENKFEIIALGYTLNIPYENLDYWELDECNSNKIFYISLHGQRGSFGKSNNAEQSA